MNIKYAYHLNNYNLGHGDYVSCKIGKKQIDDARISVRDDGQVYIVQSVDSFGGATVEVFGHKYAWYIGEMDDINLLHNIVTDFRIHKREDETPVFHVGDELVNRDGNDKGVVLSVNGNIFVTSFNEDVDRANGAWLFKETQEYGWKRKDAPEEKQDDWDDIKEKFSLETVKNALKKLTE